jgi:hypothetical protein
MRNICILLQGRSSNKNNRGIALLLVLPVFVLLTMIGLILTVIVNSRISTETSRIQSLRSKCLAKSAMQLALLEIQGRTEISENVKKNSKAVVVRDIAQIPQNGSLSFNGNPIRNIIPFSKQGNSKKIRLNSAVTENLAAGMIMYILQDLDGDDKFCSISPREFDGGIIEVKPIITNRQITENNLKRSTLMLHSTARIGSVESKIERLVFFP